MFHKSDMISILMDYCNRGYLKVPTSVKPGTILLEFELVLIHTDRKTRSRAHKITH